MPKLYNVATQKAEHVEDDQVKSLVESGQYVFPKNEFVNVVDKDGLAYSVAADQLKTAFDQGFTIESINQREGRKYIEKQGAAGSVAVGAVAAADKMFGSIGLGKDTLTKAFDATPKELETFNAAMNQAPTAKAVGEAAGTFGGFALGAKLLTAVGAGAATEGALLARGASRLAAGTAGGVADAAVFAVPNAATKLALDRPDEAAETLLYELGAGALLGAGSTIISEQVKSLVNASKTNLSRIMPNAGALQSRVSSAADDFALEAMGMQKTQAKNLGAAGRKRVSDFLFDNNLIETNADKLAKSVVYPSIGFEGRAEAIRNIRETAGKNIGATLKTLDDQILNNPAVLNQSLDLGLTQKRIEDEVMKGLSKNMNRAEINEAKRVIKDIVDLKQNATFESMQSMRSNLENKIQRSVVVDDSMNNVRKGISKIFKEEMENAAERVANASNIPNLLQDYKSFKKTYQSASDALKLVENKESMIVGNRKFGLTDNIAISSAFASPTSAIGGVGYLAGKRIMENEGKIAAASLLKKYANNPQIVSNFIGQSFNKYQKFIQSISKDINQIAAMGKVAAYQSADYLPMLWGNRKSNLSKEKQFEKAYDIITKFNESDDHVINAASSLSALFRQPSTSQLADVYNSKIIQASKYLYDSLPKPTMMGNSLKKVTFKPTLKQIKAFENKVQIYVNPFSVMNEIKQATLTPHHVEALKVLYPAIHKSLIEAVGQHAYSKEAKELPVAFRQTLSQLTGLKLDSSASNVDLYQNGFSSATNQKPSFKASLVKMPSAQTSLDKMVNRNS